MIRDRRNTADVNTPYQSEQYPRIGDYLLCVCFGIGLVVIDHWAFSRFESAWMGDAARYIEATRSFLRGEPFLLHGLDGPAPMRLWPPGYPLLAGLVALSGLDAPDSALLLAQASVALIPAACYWAVVPQIGRLAAFCAAAVCVTAPGVLAYANLVSSDPVFLVVAVLALGALIRGRFSLCMFLACLGRLIRNSGIALVLSIGITALLDSPGIQVFRQRCVSLLAGGVAPMLALIGWDLWALGTLSPYQMPPSTLGWWTNARAMGRSIAFDLVPVTSLADVLPSLIIYAACLALAAVVIVGAAWRNRFVPVPSRRACLSLGLYFCLGTIMTVTARTRYEWGEIIWARHAAQYDWLLLPLASLAAWPVRAIRPSHVRVVLCAATVLCLAVRAEDVGSRLIAVSAARPEVERMVQTGVVEPGGYVRLRQVFHAYRNVTELQFVKIASANGCTILSNITDLLVSQYDVTASDINPSRAIPSSVYAIVTMGPEAGTMPKPPPNTPQVVIDGLPMGIRVFSDRPETCLAQVKWSYLVGPNRSGEEITSTPSTGLKR